MQRRIWSGMIGLSMAFGTLNALADKVVSGQQIVDTAYVQEALKRGVIVWDVRSGEDYKRGHIPGAINIGNIARVLRKDSDEDYIDIGSMEQLLGEAGIDPTKEIIVYGDKGNPYVYFGGITIQHFNGKAGKVYHGGMDDWKSMGGAVSSEPTQLAPVALKLAINSDEVISTQDMIRHAKRKDAQIVDVRTLGEFLGEDIRALRGGHIPGATHIPYEQNWADPEAPAKLARRQVANKDGLALKSAEQLKALYAKLDPGKETIVYCQSGIRASETALVLKDIGFKNVKVYDSSWLGYGNNLEAPAEDVTYFNVGALNARLATMQRRMDVLEKALDETRGGAGK
jgi:thiosulfate/3-mercaptopyruvate sulfurtransferase